MANTTLPWHYTWKSTWSMHITVKTDAPDLQVKSEILNGIDNVVSSEFAKKMTDANVSASITSALPMLTSWSRSPSGDVHASGTFELQYDSDGGPDQTFSPAGWVEALVGVLAVVGLAIGAVFGVSEIILAVLAVVAAISALTYYNSSGGVSGTLFGTGAVAQAIGPIFLGLILIGGVYVAYQYYKGKPKKRKQT